MTPSLAQAWAVLNQVPDPEVPVISVCELGIVRDLFFNQHQALEVVLTPTYSGCPATEQIEQDIRIALNQAGFHLVHIRLQRSPAWTTDWMSAEGKRKLQDYGIAPPGALVAQPVHFFSKQKRGSINNMNKAMSVTCPRCASHETERLTEFGSTACKALYRCLSCREPFEYFKPI